MKALSLFSATLSLFFTCSCATYIKSHTDSPIGVMTRAEFYQEHPPAKRVVAFSSYASSSIQSMVVHSYHHEIHWLNDSWFVHILYDLADPSEYPWEIEGSVWSRENPKDIVYKVSKVHTSDDSREAMDFVEYGTETNPPHPDIQPYPNNASVTLRVVNPNQPTVKLGILIENKTKKDISYPDVFREFFSGSITFQYNRYERVYLHAHKYYELKQETFSPSEDVLKPGDKWEYWLKPEDLVSGNATVESLGSMVDQHFNILPQYKFLHYTPKPSAFWSGQVYVRWKNVKSNVVIMGPSSKELGSSPLPEIEIIGPVGVSH